MKKSTKKQRSDEIIEKLQKDVEGFKNDYLRVLADFRNFQKRVKDEVVKEKEREKESVVLKFLSLLDDLEQAEIFVKDEGLRLIKGKFRRVLEELGVKEISIKKGDEFSPELCEAIHVEKGREDNKITKVVRKGYLIENRVLRPARVIVSKVNL